MNKYDDENEIVFWLPKPEQFTDNYMEKLFQLKKLYVNQEKKITGYMWHNEDYDKSVNFMSDDDRVEVINNEDLKKVSALFTVRMLRIYTLPQSLLS